MDKQRKLRLATVTAMFAALIIITTAYIKIPAPLGYIHIGDSMVYLSAAILPGPFGFFAAAIGGAMADLLAGYPHWAIPTAIIKALNVLPFFLIKLLMTDRKKLEKIIHLQNLLMLIPTTLVTLGGYFVANALMYTGIGKRSFICRCRFGIGRCPLQFKGITAIKEKSPKRSRYSDKTLGEDDGIRLFGFDGDLFGGTAVLRRIDGDFQRL